MLKRVLLGCGPSVVVLCLLSSFAFAEDVGVNRVRKSTNRVRTSPKTQARPQARPSPTRPRPIQDETTVNAPPAPQAVDPAMSSRGQTSPSQTLSTGTNSSAGGVRTPARPARAAKEEAVNLDAISSSPTTPSPSSHAGKAGGSSVGGLSPHGSSGLMPNFKFYFDFLLKSWKADPNSSFSFDSYHQRMLVEYTPSPDWMFQADISSWQGPKYFEVDYMLSQSIQLRWGRIWIPFDDMSPHSIFGGRINTSEFFQPNESAFLPDIWADMGIGLKFILADSAGMGYDFHLYVVNGFQSGGNSPVAGESTAVPPVTYPNFSGTTGASTDNNNAKAFGARWHALFGHRFGIGVSGYRDTYTPKSDPEAKNITMLGLDAQLYPTNTTEIRAGFVSMKVGLAPPATKDSFTRGGSYIELGQKFGTDDRWKFLVRAGKSQNDNRVVDVSDKTLVGATLLKNFGNVEGQLTFYKDMNKVPAKTAYNYGAFRLVTAF
jgi:hypothetical protein